jgi:hypothetical protein
MPRAKPKPIVLDVSRRALVGRIDRRLRRRGQQLRADRRGGTLRHMLVDVRKGEVIETDVDLDKLARKLDVLQPWERVPSR